MSQTVDTVALTGTINQCFAKGIDARYSEPDQDAFIYEGKRLRGQLLNLLSAQFDDGTAALTVANQELTKVNTQLANDATVLENVASTLNDIATLVGNLDALLKIATSFV